VEEKRRGRPSQIPLDEFSADRWVIHRPGEIGREKW